MAQLKGKASQDRGKRLRHKGKVDTARPANPPPPSAVAERQERNKGGLLVTSELQIAIQKCKAKVERMAADCRRGNRKFRDIEFDFVEDRDQCLHALSPEKSKYTPSDVLRVTQIFDSPQFFINGATASDIQQGALGDCWFLSAMAVVAAAGLIEKVCVARDEQVGIYGFIFWRDGGWVNVIIDDLLFTQVPRWESLNAKEQLLYHQDKDFYVKTARKGGKSLYFARSLTQNETWVPLFEKAFAKLHGDYASLDGGFTHEAIEDLTGAVSQLIYSKDILDTDRFWKDQLLRANHDRLFACFTPRISSPSNGGEPGPIETNGLVNGHAYSVIRAVEYRGKRFVRVRNPWGRCEWTGRWSDGSKEWTGEWLDALKALGHTFGNDGEFIMEYSDFLETWDAIEVSQLFDSSWMISQQWLKVNAGDYPKAWNFGDVSYTVSIPNPTHAIIVLAQLDWRFFDELRGHFMWSFDFVLYKKGEEEECASSIHSTFWDRSVKMEVDLEVGDYVVHVRIDRTQFREKGYSQKTDEWGVRKYSRKRAEYLLSNSIALNFASREYGPTLPLGREIFTGKHDLTELELSLHEALLEHKAKVLETFAPQTTPKVEGEAADGEERKGGGDMVTDEESKTEDGKAMEEEAETKDSSKVEAGAETKGETKEKDESASGEVTSRGVRPDIAEVLPKKFQLDIHPNEPKIDDDKDGEKSDKESKGKGGDEDVTKEEITEIIKEAIGDKKSEGSKEVSGSGPVEESLWSCDGCKKPITAGRYRCLHAACRDYDLCDNCIKVGAHAEDHKFLHIPTTKDGLAFPEGNEELPENNSVVLGLRVYTNKDSPAVIKGQLRHAHVIRHALTYSRII